MSWSPSRLLGNALYRMQVRMTVKDPHIRAAELAQSAKDSGSGWCPEVYVRMTHSALEEIGALDTRFSDVVGKALAVKFDAKTMASVYKQTLVAISLNYGGPASEVAGLVAHQAMRGLNPQQQKSIEDAFNGTTN